MKCAYDQASGRISRIRIAAALGFPLLLGNCVDPAESARIALQVRGIAVEPSAFVSAAILGHTESMELLELAGVSPHAVDPGSGKTPLLAAIEGGQWAPVEFLVQSGADISSRFPDGRSPLGVAFENGRYEMAERLLTQGLDTKEPFVKGGDQPLLAMLRIGDLRAAELLVKFGAPTEAATKHLPELSKAALARGEGEFTRLLRLIPKNEDSPAVGYPLGDALDRRLFHAAETLVEQGVDPNSAGSAQLIEAVADGDLRRLRHLLALGMNSDTPDAAGSTAVEWAVSLGDLEAVEILIGFGCDPTPGLLPAIAAGDVSMTKSLLEAGASLRDESDSDSEKETPLGLAVSTGNVAMIRLLIGHGTDPNKPGALGQPPLLVAAASQDELATRALLECGADPDVRSISPHSSDFRSLVSGKTLDFYLRKDSRLTALMMAAAQDDVPTLETLMANGATRWLYSGKYKRYAVNFAAERSHIHNQQRLLGRDPANETVKREVVVDLSEQRARLFEDGEVVLSSKVSTGKKGFRTPTGSYVISNKYKKWTSTIYHSSMPYFQRLSCGSFGFHVGYVPNYPASHGCIRMPHSNAVALFKKTEIGDLVRIVP